MGARVTFYPVDRPIIARCRATPTPRAVGGHRSRGRTSINGRFRRRGLATGGYQYRSVIHKKLCALYQSADVASITPLRDGMNLVAKELWRRAMTARAADPE
ncbi:MAG: trehalose-6-phosphate synthase [Flavobacteriales bacterium]|nr:trehalose-6-phosphate synthase [Flavobacteriales bacterium]